MPECVYPDCRALMEEKRGCEACGRCQCGCRALAPIAKWNRPDLAHVKGKPTRFLRGHSGRISIIEWPSKLKIEELYSIGRTIQYVADFISDLNGRTIWTATVRTRMIELGIPLLPTHEHNKWTHKHPHVASTRSRNMSAVNRRIWAGVARPGHTKGIKAAIKAAAIAKLARRVLVVCKCGCRRIKSLPPCKVLPEGNYYSGSCRARHLNHERKLKRLTLTSAMVPPVPIRIPEWARGNVERLHQLQQEEAGE